MRAGDLVAGTVVVWHKAPVRVTLVEVLSPRLVRVHLDEARPGIPTNVICLADDRFDLPRPLG